MIMRKSLISLCLIAVSSIAFAKGGPSHQFGPDFGDRSWEHPQGHGFSFAVMGIYDQDKNHYLDEKEFSSYIDAAKEYAILQEKSIQTFNSLDLNKDTFVSFDEFIKFKPAEFKPEFAIMHHPRPHHEHFDSKPPIPHGERMQNNDQKKDSIGKDEWRKQPNSFDEDFEKIMKNDFVFKCFNFHDKNHDGKLSAEEYGLFYQNQLLELVTFKAFVDGLSLKNLDANGDGVISSKEIKYYRDGLLVKKAPTYNSK